MVAIAGLLFAGGRDQAVQENHGLDRVDDADNANTPAGVSTGLAGDNDWGASEASAESPHATAATAGLGCCWDVTEGANHGASAATVHAMGLLRARRAQQGADSAFAAVRAARGSGVCTLPEALGRHTAAMRGRCVQALAAAAVSDDAELRVAAVTHPFVSSCMAAQTALGSRFVGAVGCSDSGSRRDDGLRSLCLCPVRRGGQRTLPAGRVETPRVQHRLRHCQSCR